MGGGGGGGGYGAKRATPIQPSSIAADSGMFVSNEEMAGGKKHYLSGPKADNLFHFT